MRIKLNISYSYIDDDVIAWHPHRTFETGGFPLTIMKVERPSQPKITVWCGAEMALPLRLGLA